MAERFIAAAKEGNMDILRTATKKDLNRDDEDGMTATMWAAHNGNLEALRMVLGREGDPNKCDILGLTSLHHAAMCGHLDVVSFLVNWGCNIYSRDNDMHTAQDLASLHNHDDIIRYLDSMIVQKKTKNPKHSARQSEEAIKAAESNQKRYEKLQEAAAKRAEKEQRKGKPSGVIDRPTWPKKWKNKTNKKEEMTSFSEIAGLPVANNAKGTIKNRPVNDFPSTADPPDSGFDEDEENSSSNVDRRKFGKMVFHFQRSNMMINNIQGLPSELDEDPKLDDDTDPDSATTLRSEGKSGSSSNGKLPWNEDDVDVLDENDDNDIPKMKQSALETFLASIGLIGYLYLFSQEDIELEVLMKMTEKDLQVIKLPHDPRMKLSEAINRRKQILDSPSNMIDTHL